MSDLGFKWKPLDNTTVVDVVVEDEGNPVDKHNAIVLIRFQWPPAHEIEQWGSTYREIDI